MVKSTINSNQIKGLDEKTNQLENIELTQILELKIICMEEAEKIAGGFVPSHNSDNSDIVVG